MDVWVTMANIYLTATTVVTDNIVQRSSSLTGTKSANARRLNQNDALVVLMSWFFRAFATLDYS